jgi:hypothetical protein
MGLVPENLASQPPTESYVGPIVPISIGGSALELTRQNTLLKTFTVGAGMFDHIVHRLSDGRQAGISTDIPGGDVLRDDLIEKGFAHRVADVIDDRTWSWHFGEQMDQVTHFLDHEVQEG